MENALLRPMQPGSLAPRRPPVATYEPRAQVDALSAGPPAPQADALLHPAVMAPMPVHDALEAELDEFFTAQPEDEEDDLPDAVPSSQMPVPVCVPLYEEMSPPRPSGRSRWWLRLLAVLACAAAAAGGAYVRMRFGPLF